MAMFSYARFCLRVLADLNEIIRWLKRNVIMTIAIERTDAYRNISTVRKCLFKVEPIVYILKSVLSLRSFNREFTRFLKKHYPWSDLTKKIPRPLSYYL